MFSSIGSVIDRMLGSTAQQREAYREWDRLRSQAFSQSERDEIDAIFSRQIDSV